MARAAVANRLLAIAALIVFGAFVAIVAAGVFGRAASAAVPDAALDVLRPDVQGRDGLGTPPASRRSLAEFAIAAAPREFEFPQDHGPHPDFRQEWWYLTGNLTATDGERFGFELTIFRVALTPAGDARSAVASDGAGVRNASSSRGVGGTRNASSSRGVGRTRNAASSSDDTGSRGTAAALDGASTAEHLNAAPAASPWRTRQVYVGHFAVTDVARHTFRFTQRYERDALGLAGTVADPFRVWLYDWQIGGSPHWSLHAQQKDYELQLEVQSLAAPILNGDRGLSVKASDPGAASYYYSIPRVSVRGHLIRDRVPIDVSGVAWLDREWGSGSLGANESGWDWFALQLDDGSALMFYALRDKDGARDLHSAGTWVDRDGQTRSLSSSDVEITVGSYWDSPRGGRYPSRWHVRVPSLALEADVQPVLADQELGTSPRYWEGAVDVMASRSGASVAGRGYVELVGYAR
ncbi:MAG TPA: lipocalin-like domain-containing protein [Steroidobacteraceae bacterium]|nr:lipocalin-like domain-containing protein [Steroidobacteraceae bacterium]